MQLGFWRIYFAIQKLGFLTLMEVPSEGNMLHPYVVVQKSKCAQSKRGKCESTKGNTILRRKSLTELWVPPIRRRWSYLKHEEEMDVTRWRLQALHGHHALRKKMSGKIQIFYWLERPTMQLGCADTPRTFPSFGEAARSLSSQRTMDTLRCFCWWFVCPLTSLHCPRTKLLRRLLLTTLRSKQ